MNIVQHTEDVKSVRKQQKFRVKSSQGISYAEAVKRVPVQSERPKEKETEGITKSVCDGCVKIKDTLIVGKKDFILFM